MSVPHLVYPGLQSQQFRSSKFVASLLLMWLKFMIWNFETLVKIQKLIMQNLKYTLRIDQLVSIYDSWTTCKRYNGHNYSWNLSLPVSMFKSSFFLFILALFSWMQWTLEQVEIYTSSKSDEKRIYRVMKIGVTFSNLETIGTLSSPFFWTNL